MFVLNEENEVDKYENEIALHFKLIRMIFLHLKLF